MSRDYPEISPDCSDNMSLNCVEVCVQQHALLQDNPCPAGYYGERIELQAQEQCTLCPEGKYCAGTGNDDPTDDCDAGYLCPTGQTESAPSAFECPTGNT